MLSVLALEELRRAARLLGARGIPLLPLKGVLAQCWLYDDPAERILTDVDVLVRPEHFEEAVTGLCEGGFSSPRRVSMQGQIVLQGPTGVALDLHAWPLGPHRFSRFGAASWLRRARLGREPFGEPLWVPHPEDFYLHLAGKVLLDRLEPGDGRSRWEEIVAAPRRLGLVAEALLARAGAVGLAKALRHAWRAALRSGVGDAVDRRWVERALRRGGGGGAFGFESVLSSRVSRSGGWPSVVAAYSLEEPVWAGWRALLLRGISSRTLEGVNGRQGERIESQRAARDARR